MLNSVYSNSTWAGETLTVNLNKPFDIIAVSSKDYQRKKATFPEENDLLKFGVPIVTELITEKYLLILDKYEFLTVMRRTGEAKRRPCAAEWLGLTPPSTAKID